MKEYWKKLRRCNRDIEDIQGQISAISVSPFYEVFTSEYHREKDLNTCKMTMQDYLKEKFVHLENLQLEIEKEKHRVSQEQRIFTLQTAQ